MRSLTLPGPLARRRRAAIVACLSLVSALAASLLFTSPYIVEKSSMEPTLSDGELLLVDRVGPRLHGYERGDVVVFEAPQGNRTFVKRIIGLPGETVAIAGGLVRVNGTPLAEPYARLVASGRTRLELRVPAGTYLVLGDNREISYDSRAFGPVPVERIAGRAWAGLSLVAAVRWLPAAGPLVPVAIPD